jgi:hypothetical protein
MRRRFYLFLALCLVAALAAPANAADQRTQYNEELVGAGHPSKSDTINRLALVQHTNEGIHKAPTPRCRLYRDGVQAIADTTWTAVAWPAASEYEDTDGLHGSTNTSRVTVNKAGLWLVSGIVSFTANATGWRGLEIMVNGAPVVIGPTLPAVSAGTHARLSFSQVLSLAANDYVEIFVYQSSGGSLDLLGEATGMKFTVIYLGTAS